MPEWMKPLVKEIRKKMLHKNGVKVGNLPNSDLQRKKASETGKIFGKRPKSFSKEHQAKAGHLGGKKLQSLGKGVFAFTPEQRSECARKAALARWNKHKQSEGT